MKEVCECGERELGWLERESGWDGLKGSGRGDI